MKIAKSIIVVYLTVCLLLMLVSGCAKTPAPDQSAAPEQSEAPAVESESAAPAQDSTTEETPEPEQTEPEITGVAGEAAIAAIAAGEIDRSVSLPLTTGGEVLSYWVTSNFSTASGINTYLDHYGLKYVQEQTGITLDISESNQTTAAEQFNLMLAGGSLADIVVDFQRYYSFGMDKAVEDKIIVDINDYMDSAPVYGQLLACDPALKVKLESDAGRMCAFYSLCTEYSWVKQSTTLRGDWLKELGLELPKTYEEYFDVMKAFKSEYNPEYCFDMGTNLANTWFEGGFGINVSTKGSASTSDFYVDDDTVRSGYTSDRFRSYLTLLNEWYNEGLISSDYPTIGDLEFFENEYTPLISSGQFGMMEGPAGLFENYVKASNDEDFSLVASYLPRQADDPTLCYLAPATLTGSEYSPSISASCGSIALAVALCDYYYSDDGAMVAQYGVEGLSWEYDENGEPQFTELITSQRDLAGANMAYKVNTGSILSPNQSFKLMASEEAQGIMQFWTDDQSQLSNAGNNAYYPSDVTLTGEETENASTALADIATYVSEAVPGFIMGTKSLGEFDSYCNDLNAMGLEDVVGIYQAAYDRYIGK